MAFQPITTTEIMTGKPNATTVAEKVRSNFNDHEERLLDLEQGGAVAYPPIQLAVHGYYGDQGPATNWTKFIPNFNLTIVGARAIVDRAGSSGVLEIDIQVKSGANPYASIFTTRPSVAFSAGDDAVSTNQVLDGSKVNILAGDIIRLDTTAVQANGHSFYVRIDYVKG